MDKNLLIKLLTSMRENDQFTEYMVPLLNNINNSFEKILTLRIEEANQILKLENNRVLQVTQIYLLINDKLDPKIKNIIQLQIDNNNRSAYYLALLSNNKFFLNHNHHLEILKDIANIEAFDKTKMICEVVGVNDILKKNNSADIIKMLSTVAQCKTIDDLFYICQIAKNPKLINNQQYAHIIKILCESLHPMYASLTANKIDLLNSIKPCELLFKVGNAVSCERSQEAYEFISQIGLVKDEKILKILDIITSNDNKFLNHYSQIILSPAILEHPQAVAIVNSLYSSRGGYQAKYVVKLLKTTNILLKDDASVIISYIANAYEKYNAKCAYEIVCSGLNYLDQDELYSLVEQVALAQDTNEVTKKTLLAKKIIYEKSFNIQKINDITDTAQLDGLINYLTSSDDKIDTNKILKKDNC